MKQSPKIFVYGFSQFDIIKRNPSAGVVEILAARSLAFPSLDTAVLKAAYESVPMELQDRLSHRVYDIVCGFGAAVGSTGLRLETTALNLIDSAAPDVEGRIIRNQPIDAAGPAAIVTRADLISLSQELLRRGIPSYVSHFAYTYICNYAYYLTASVAIKLGSPRCVFVHLPITTEFACEAALQVASLPLDLMVKGCEIVLQHLMQELDRI